LSGSAADSDTISPEACLAAHRAREPDRLGERELLARSQGDEARAAQLTARLPAAIDQDEIAPRRKPGLASTEAPEHHAVALQQDAGGKLDTAL